MLLKVTRSKYVFVSKLSIFLSFCNSDACLDRAPRKILPVALIVSLVVHSGFVLESTIANSIGCRKNCGFSW